MRHSSSWQPTKFHLTGGRLRASKDSDQVGVGSRLIADITAHCYEVLLPKYCRGRLLDLGCGEAPLYGYYQGLVGEVLCTDWPSTIHETRHVDVQCDLANALPFSDGAFDTIVLSDVLEHIPEPLLLCREMARILAPGGRLILNVPFYYWLHEEPHDYYRYTEFALRRFMAASELEILELAPVGGPFEIVVDILSKRAQRFRRVGRALAAGMQAAAGSLLRPSGRSLWTRPSSRFFPLAYFLVAERAPG